MALPLDLTTLEARPMLRADLPLLGAWLSEPRTRDVWGGAQALPNIASHLTDPRVDQWIITAGGTDVAYLQDYDIAGYDDHPLAALPAGARGIDTFIGRETWMGLGLGPAYLIQHVERLFGGGVPALGIDPDPGNTAAIKAYQKAGFEGSESVTTKWGEARIMILWPDRLARRPR